MFLFSFYYYCSLCNAGFFPTFYIASGIIFSLIFYVKLLGDVTVCDKVRIQFQISQVWDQLAGVLIFICSTFVSLLTRLWTWFRAGFKMYILSVNHHNQWGCQDSSCKYHLQAMQRPGRLWHSFLKLQMDKELLGSYDRKPHRSTREDGCLDTHGPVKEGFCNNTEKKVTNVHQISRY
jgi:hypothetical protein